MNLDRPVALLTLGLALAGCNQPGGSDGPTDETGESGDETAGDGDGDGDGDPEGPLYLVVARFAGFTGTADVQIADVTDPGTPAVLEPLLTPAPGELIGSGARGDRWYAYAVGVAGDYSLMLLDVVNQPFGPLTAIDDVPAGALNLRRSADQTLLGVVDAVEFETGPGYIISLADEPGPAQVLSSAVEDIAFSPGGQHVWARLAEPDQARQLAVARIQDGVVEPLTVVTSFPATEIGAFMPEAISEAGAMYQVSYVNGFDYWAHYADVSAWPTVVETPLATYESGVVNRWVFASDTSAAIRLHAPSDAPDFRYDADLIRVVDGQVQPPQTFAVDPIDVHDVYISPDNRFAFFAQLYVGEVDDLGVARLDGPSPTEVTPLSTAVYEFLGNDAVVFAGDWAVWRFGAGGLRAVWLGDEDVGPVIELLASPEIPGSLSALGSRILYRADDPVRPIWMFDLSGPTPSEPVSVTHELAAGDIYLGPTVVSPYDDRLFYRTRSSDQTESLWIRSLASPDAAQQLVIPGDGFGFSLLAPPS